ncbi:OmpA family protein [Neolewinella antarctica]|uniref:Outer membrane protein OmpA-like peptidoglycan-associated protein n=1 Tax=Neolewinella antarctica TaxID=442734 RepID=A0ABX0X9S1_9BACT|nr:OmpA family protein [Neolewinella antarctica]NJC25977.1 outer membrane protein OmpA-like peptidoglycan-associated protein [Neolewinella antarctica]
MHLTLPRYFTALLLLVCSLVQAQDSSEILLRNPSFEDMPRNSAAPRGWTDCGFPGESAPDVHPDPRFEFRVAKQAQHGLTYLGMVTRDNETYESVGQQLSSPVVAGQCYELNIQMARSEIYLSRSQRTKLQSNYVTPAVLRVYGGYSVCQRGEKIGQSDIVENYDWREFRVKLSPTEAYTYITFEVYYKPQTMLPYNGNILLDNTQALKPIDCDKDLSVPDAPIDAEPAITLVDPDEDIMTQPIVRRDLPSPRKPVSTPPAAEPEEPQVKLGTTTASLKEGAIFRIENITFKANSAEIESESEEALEEIIGFLRDNDNVIIEVGGHASYKASSGYANTLSGQRARSVIEYLQEHRIPVNRMFPRGYGNTRPVCRSEDAECNARNQRVEVKILKLSR